TTDQDGLYCYGCCTFTQRSDLVNVAVDKYLKPFLIGKPADRIDDTWQACYNSSYWRNGPVLNNAISGVDQALWDVKGRQAGLPVYQLLGGKCREAVDCYSHASGGEIPEAIDSARKLMAAGFRHVRVQVGVPGMAGYGAGRGARRTAGRLSDDIRIPVSQAGVLAPCRKIAALGEIYNVRTAWHGPGDVSPIGHCANVALDIACYNFGIQEYSAFNQASQEVFKGCPVMKNGYLYPNEAPGWGVEIDEKIAAKYPFGGGREGSGERGRLNGGWGEVR